MKNIKLPDGSGMGAIAAKNSIQEVREDMRRTVNSLNDALAKKKINGEEWLSGMISVIGESAATRYMCKNGFTQLNWTDEGCAPSDGARKLLHEMSLADTKTLRRIAEDINSGKYNFKEGSRQLAKDTNIFWKQIK